MDNQLDNKMEKFLEEAQCTLDTLKKTVNWFKYLASGIIALMLTFVIDTRIEVVKKVDASEVQKEYVNKVDALNVHKLEKKYMDDIINCALNQGIAIETQNNEWIIESILNKNYTE